MKYINTQIFFLCLISIAHQTKVLPSKEQTLRTSDLYYPNPYFYKTPLAFKQPPQFKRCDDSSNETNCSRCSPGDFLSYNQGCRLEVCPENCNCDQGRCTSCKKSYLYPGSHCSKCMFPYQPNQYGQCQINSCPYMCREPNFQWGCHHFAKECYTKQCPKQCECDDKKICIKCKQPQKMLASNCQSCDDNYEFDESGKCVSKCPKHCQCVGPVGFRKCETCHPGFFYPENDCKSTEEVYYILETGQKVYF